jgi:hypothetical protein
MARVTQDLALPAEVLSIMEEMGVDEIEARFILALLRDETFGDVQSIGPMTPEERRRIGLDIVAGGPFDPDLRDDQPESDGVIVDELPNHRSQN